MSENESTVLKKDQLEYGWPIPFKRFLLQCIDSISPCSRACNTDSFWSWSIGTCWCWHKKNNNILSIKI